MKPRLVFCRLEGDPFNEDDVRIRRVHGEERISQLSTFDIEVVVPPDFDAAACEGERATLVFEVDGAEIRRVAGEIASVDDNLDEDARVLTLRLVPRAARLLMVTTQEVFLGLSVPEIVRKKLEAVGVAEPHALEFRLLSDYPARDLVIQYKETDLAFCQRLLEHVGVSFFFETNPKGEDRLVITDHPTGFRPVDGAVEVPFRPRGEKRDVYSLSAKRTAIPRFFMEQDYNYRAPLVDLSGSAAAPSGKAGGVVEYGAHVKTPEESAFIARIRAEEAESRHLVFTGQSDNGAIMAGAVLTVSGHPKLHDATLTITSVEHTLTQVTGLGASDETAGYQNTFTAISSDVPYRPPRVTPKPKINGLLTGIVEPEQPGDESRFARIDEQGRYTIRFLFDTTVPGERKASSPIRLLQPHVGAGYGMHLPLKPGVEVALGFIDGDPDRPLIVGAVPNPLTPSPVTRQNAPVNRIQTETGIVFEMKDA